MNRHSGLTKEQIEQLLRPINPNRVMTSQGHSHVTQQDITAHLIRIFGFGNFDIEILNIEHVFTENYVNAKTKEITGGYSVCYKCVIRLTIKDVHGNKIAFYENGSTATALNLSLGDGHDLAYKSAISLSIKRCAIALGDQFGLSLYNKGQKEALVMDTLIGKTRVTEQDVQTGVSQQVSLGNDEIEEDREVISKLSPKKDTPLSEKEVEQFASLNNSIFLASSVADLMRIATGNIALLDIQFPASQGDTTLRTSLDFAKALLEESAKSSK